MRAGGVAKGAVGAVKTTSRIRAGNLKEFKALVNELSQHSSELTATELAELHSLTEKFGGKLRYDLNPVKGKLRKPHVQVEGLGSKVGRRHINLGEGVK